MQQLRNASGEAVSTTTDSSLQLTTPQIALPKGGGAIRGVGEKFSANPVTGTGSITVPIFTSPGRSGFGPQLTLSYDSGAGNGPFGMGWQLPIPAITRKTEKGLPRYDDAHDSDIFILSGSEDLVSLLEQDSKPRSAFGSEYFVRKYRPRVEGLFARIERWSDVSRTDRIFWRSISRDNVTTWYGKSEDSRIADPSDSSRIFSWLICESYDDKANLIAYSYVGEDDSDVDLMQSNERNRLRTANRYPRSICYCNHSPYIPDLSLDPSKVPTPEWHLEIVFDYHEGNDLDALLSDPKHPKWKRRPDPFSSYRGGFEVRTYRLCQRVLMLHHFKDEAEIGANYLVKSTNFEYLNDEDPTAATNPIFSKLLSITQTGHQKALEPRSLPPLEFTYSDALIDQEIHEVDSQSLENLPYGLDGTHYQWVDLDGEGVSGILSEQGGAWFYKRNLSPLTGGNAAGQHFSARFGPAEVIGRQPAPIASELREQLLDLEGDGDLDLAEFGGDAPGYYKRTEDQGWAPMVPFRILPTLDWNNPNLKFIDLTGDGHADILISEDQVFRWHPSQAEAGFGHEVAVVKPNDEEVGPTVLFADSTESIFLADFSGDGLTDIVRIRNGEVCYWPNLGYGHFGTKVQMDNAPWFEPSDLFDGKRIRLADIDGSGTTDIIYLAGNKVQVYFNQSGNSWSAKNSLDEFPPVDDLDTVLAFDLLGNGTACLVWSSPLIGNTRAAMWYMDLMGGQTPEGAAGQKPHLLIGTKNNLGSETTIEYAPSTKYYLQDKQAGTPWLTRLPFPIHCVEHVTVHDQWRDTWYTSSYTYHHGYYDGIEREFRGFGRVEQVDVEDYDKFAGANNSLYITQDQHLYQPPVKTVTWYHTGVFRGEKRLLSHFADEYFPNWLAAAHPEDVGILQKFKENQLPEPDFADQDLSGDEWREALRACKGMVLRQEIYELDVAALANKVHKPVKLFSTAYCNCHIRRLQPRGRNPFAVFLVTESEAITYHYELPLSPLPVAGPDPRVAHTLNLKVDDFGHVLQSVSLSYGRRGTLDDPTLPAGAPVLIQKSQSTPHFVFTQSSYTDVDSSEGMDDHRVPLPWEVKTYEFTGLTPDGYVSLADLRSYQLGDAPFDAASVHPMTEIPYHQVPDGTLQQRVVEHVRTIYFADDLTSLPVKKLGRLGLKYEDYKLALTDDFLTAVLGNKLNDSIQGSTAKARIADASESGYLSGAQLTTRFAGLKTQGQYWIRSGTAGFSGNVPPFYIPDRYADAFGNVTKIKFDQTYYLYLQSVVDALGNTTSVDEFDFRVLAPRQMKEVNGNVSAIAFDRLGLPAAMALLGKGESGDRVDSLADNLLNPSIADATAFFNSNYSDAKPRAWLGDATARYVYWFGEGVAADGSVTWVNHPAAACGILREQHVAVVEAGGGSPSPLQVAVEYSDGLGSVLVKKGQAEPAAGKTALQWIASGKSVLNNKGKPVKQFEPYLSTTDHRFDESEAQQDVGVTSITYYDAPGRLIRIDSPDGSYSRVEFTPWEVSTWDQNDTVLEPGNAWYAANTGALASAEAKRAAQLASEHAGTPSETFLDSLGRNVFAVVHNKFTDAAGTAHDEKYVTFTKLDAEGKALWIRDARGNLVMQYITTAKANNDPNDDLDPCAVPCYDIAGNLLFQHSMDAGDRWIVANAAGKPMLALDFNQRQSANGPTDESRIYLTTYDSLHRPLEQWLAANNQSAQMVERFEYIDTSNNDASALQNNLQGKLVRHYDPGGLTETIRRDFKGNVEEVHRTLNNQPQASLIDWQGANPGAKLTAETFVQITEHDALNRMTRLYNWHRGTGSRVAVYEPAYSERGSLKSEQLTVRASKTTAGFAAQADTQVAGAIQEIGYNVKGQKEYVQLGNGTVTRYAYDPQTFRLTQLRTTRPVSDPPFPDTHSKLADANILQQLNYSYDPVGNITEIYDEAFVPEFFQNQKIEPHAQYQYDALYRLITATGRENGAFKGIPGNPEDQPVAVRFAITDPNALRKYTQTFTYDTAGNILTIHHEAGVGTYTRNMEPKTDNNQLGTSWDGNDNPTTHVYDAHGNLLNFLNVTPAQYLRWDHRDMIVNIDLGGGGNAFYQYDASKQRTRKVVQNGLVKERIYLGGYELYRATSNGVVVEEIESHHLFEGTNRVLLVDDVFSTKNAKLPTGQLWRYQYSDHLGSACLELRDDAEIISYEEFHPYGTSAYRANTANLEAPAKRYRYTGMERDEESGLSYHEARYYAPWIGRWASTDPAEMRDGPNLYQYCSGEPIRMKDSRGTAGESDTKKELDAVLGTIARYEDQALRGKAKIAEHVIPHKLVEYLMQLDPKDKSPGTEFLRKIIGKSLITDKEYEKATTIIWEKTAAYLKTYGAGDLQQIRNVRTLIESGGAVDALTNLDAAAKNALAALDKSGSKVTRAELLKSMTLQLSEYASKATFRAGTAEYVNRKTAEIAAKGETAASSVEARLGTQAADTSAATASPEAGDRLNEYGVGLNESVASSGAVGSLGDLKNQTYGVAIDQLRGADAGVPSTPVRHLPKAPIPPPEESGWFDWLPDFLKSAPDAGTANDAIRRGDKAFQDYQRKHPY